MTKTQQGQIIAAVIVFVVALCNVFGINLPVVPLV